MLSKVQPFTARPTLAQANARVEEINKARVEVVRIALEAAQRHGLCSVVEETLQEAGFGDLCGPKRATVTIPVTLTFDLDREAVMDYADESAAALEIGTNLLIDHVPSGYYSDDKYVLGDPVLVGIEEREE